MIFLCTMLAVLGAFLPPARDFCSPAELRATPPVPGEFFGAIVRAHGDLLLVSALAREVPNGSLGEIELHQRSRDGRLSLVGKISSPNPVALFFGRRVVSAGRYIVAGSEDTPRDGFAMAGEMFVFEESDGTWQSYRLEPPEVYAQQFFGGAVAANDELVAVRANLEGSIEKQVLIYQRGESGWHLSGELEPPTGLPEFALRSFGAALAVGPDFIAATLPLHEPESSDWGRLYIYRLVEGQWIISDVVHAPREAVGAEFGLDVEMIDEDTLAVSAKFGLNPDGEVGRVYLVSRVGDDAWEITAEIVPPISTFGSGFGRDMKSADGWLAVGASNDYSAGFNTGIAYAINLGSNEVTTILEYDEDSDGGFGARVSMYQGLIAISDVRASYEGQSFAGRVHLVDPTTYRLCRHDLTDDGTVDAQDLETLLQDWGESSDTADFDCSGDVGFQDLLQLFTNWGECTLSD